MRGQTPSLGGNTYWTFGVAPKRTFTNGAVVPGATITKAHLVMNRDTLVLMFSSIGASYALNALQRLVARDVLYPYVTPEPTTGALLGGAVLVASALASRSRSGRPVRSSTRAHPYGASSG